MVFSLYILCGNTAPTEFWHHIGLQARPKRVVCCLLLLQETNNFIFRLKMSFRKPAASCPGWGVRKRELLKALSMTNIVGYTLVLYIDLRTLNTLI